MPLAVSAGVIIISEDVISLYCIFVIFATPLEQFLVDFIRIVAFIAIVGPNRVLVGIYFIRVDADVVLVRLFHM